MKAATKLKYYNHTKERFLERFGRALTHDEHEYLCEMCRLGEATEVRNRERSIRHVSRLLVKLNGTPVVCAYDKKNNLLRTVLFPNKRITRPPKQ